MKNRNRLRAGLATVVAAPLLIGALSGCGTDDSEASAGGGSSDSKSSKTVEQKFEEYQLDMAQCMRDNGVDMPDPGGDGSVDISGDAKVTQKAMTTCREKLGPPPANPAREGKSDEEVFQQQLKAAECFRDNGFEVRDPQRGQAAEAPTNVPEDVLKKCVGSAAQPVDPGAAGGN